MEVAGVVALAVGVSTLVTFGGTKLWDAYRMERKFRTKGAAEKCMKAREKAEGDIKSMLRRVERRLQLGNLAIADLWETTGLSPTKLAQYEKALNTKMRDNNQND